MKNAKQISACLIVCIAMIAALFFGRVHILDAVRQLNRESIPAATTYQQQVKTNQADLPPSPSLSRRESPRFASQVNLAVPFTSQAPTGDWSQPYQDACEEAAVLMVHEFYAGNAAANVNPTVATKELLDLVALENKLFGYYADTTVAETAQFAEAMYGYGKSEIIENPTIDQIKDHLNRGEPVLFPAAGRLLKNPYFTPPGPPYHLIVIRGYTKDNKFITNDPGTKHGAAYLYSFETIMNAMHDWNAQDMLKGKKVILILHP